MSNEENGIEIVEERSREESGGEITSPVIDLVVAELSNLRNLSGVSRQLAVKDNLIPALSDIESPEVAEVVLDKVIEFYKNSYKNGFAAVVGVSDIPDIEVRETLSNFHAIMCKLAGVSAISTERMSGVNFTRATGITGNLSTAIELKFL